MRLGEGQPCSFGAVSKRLSIALIARAKQAVSLLDYGLRAQGRDLFQSNSQWSDSRHVGSGSQPSMRSMAFQRLLARRRAFIIGGGVGDAITPRRQRRVFPGVLALGVRIHSGLTAASSPRFLRS